LGSVHLKKKKKTILINYFIQQGNIKLI